MSENRTESPFQALGRRFAVGVDRVLALPGRVLVALANVGQRAANGCTGWIAREPEVVLVMGVTLAMWTLLLDLSKSP